ncbi:MAG: hypothetical protein HYZ75_15580 [Elusimicrobia bacterium]|nr:hypothetical protein [Elusimicrobiota bacterium]
MNLAAAPPDPALAELRGLLGALKADEADYSEVVNLTANENTLSKTARSVLGSALGDRYFVGVWGDREASDDGGAYYVDEGLLVKGMPAAAGLERLAARLANSMFHSRYCDFRPLSGMCAVTSVIAAATQADDRFYIFAPKTLGHHASAALLTRMGRKVEFLPWEASSMSVDLEALRRKVRAAPPRAVLLDYGSPFYPLPTREIREIIGPEPLLVYDGSHVLGLIAGGQFQDPLNEGCDILIGNTHKTFPGPQKGLILYRDARLGKEVSDVINVTTVSTQQTHQSLALFIAMVEMGVHAADYAAQVLANSKAFSSALEAGGFDLLGLAGRPSETHMVAVQGPFSGDNHAACGALQDINLNANSKGILGRGVIRLGVQDATRRGMKEPQMRELAALMRERLLGGRPGTPLKARARELARAFGGLHYTLDEELSRP